MPFIGLSKPAEQALSPALKVGDKAPQGLASSTCYSLVLFLRHPGCPFAEAMLKDLSDISAAHAELHCIAVLHGDQDTAQAWVNEFDLDPDLELVFDEDRKRYGQWGVGYGGITHLLHPGMALQFGMLFLDGIHNRDATGTRWQTHACFLVSPKQTIEWVFTPKHAGDLPDFNQAASSIWN